jgi:hypothetical protein
VADAVGERGLRAGHEEHRDGALIAFLTPLGALFASDQDITWRVLVACLLSGALAGLTVWATGNDDAPPVRSTGRHSADLQES